MQARVAVAGQAESSVVPGVSSWLLLDLAAKELVEAVALKYRAEPLGSTHQTLRIPLRGPLVRVAAEPRELPGVAEVEAAAGTEAAEAVEASHSGPVAVVEVDLPTRCLTSPKTSLTRSAPTSATAGSSSAISNLPR